MSNPEPENPYYVVGKALYEAMSDDDADRFDDLPLGEQQNFKALAEHAMTAHNDWMAENGFRVAPPGTMLRPKSEGDAKAMILAAKEFLATNSKQSLLGRPKLIIPGRVN